MIDKIILTIVTFLISSALGYCVKAIKGFKDRADNQKKNENIQNQALITILQSNLTNTYFVYQNIGEIPDYIYRNWTNLFSIYKKLGGNDYCDTLNHKMEKWKIVRTDVLDEKN